MTHGALFAGIGGFSLAARRVDIQTVWHSEIDNYCRGLLLKNFPNSLLYGDIRNLHKLPPVDIVSGGFPCQDISSAGKGLGLEGPRSSLWWEMYRIIESIRPKYAIIENSPIIVKRGLVSVLRAFAAIGYDAEWRVFSASQFGYPHIRKRLFLIAYPSGTGTVLQQNGKIGAIPQKAPKEMCTYHAVEWVDGHTNYRNIRRDYGVSKWVDRTRAIGNAIVPDIAEYIFQQIVKKEKHR